VFNNKHTIADMYNGLSLKKIGTHTLFHDLLKQNGLTFAHENLTIFLSNHHLAFVAEDFHRIGKLLEALDEIKDDFDIVLIDNGPYIGYLTRAALLAANMVLVPTEAGAGGLAGIPQIIQETEAINARHWRQVMIRVFVNNFQHSEDFDIRNLQRLKSLVGNRLYNTYIPTNIHLRKSKEMGLPINLIDKAAKTPVQGAMAFKILAKNILKDLFPDFKIEAEGKAKPISGKVRRVADAYQPQSPVTKKITPQVPSTEATPRLRVSPSHTQVTPSAQYTRGQDSHPFGSVETNTITTSTGNTAYASRPIGENENSR
jgi:cellulose biosynthesis protein BcsQ